MASQKHSQGVIQSLIGLVSATVKTWAIERTADCEVRVSNARRRVAEAQMVAEEAEDECDFRRHVRAVGPGAAREIIGADTEVQRLLLERELLRRERLQSGCYSALPPPPVPALPPGPVIEPHITDEQIETLALRAVTRFASLPSSQAEPFWAAWQVELHRRFPPNTAAEIAERATTLRMSAE